MNKVQYLTDRKLITPPKFLPDNVVYEVYIGSIAYGVSDDNSDLDIYGVCIPPKDIIFPHLVGHVWGFGEKPKEFWQYQEHHITDHTANGGKGCLYDLTIYNIVKYFQLCMENNPNMIDSLFVPHRCIITQTAVGQMIRQNRTLFLHKGSWHKFKGYAYSQLHKMESTNRTGKRLTSIKQFGYDVKFAYHVVRLLLECEQILIDGNIDLERDREQLKSIRRGEWTKEQIKDFFGKKEFALENIYHTSTAVPYRPDEQKIKSLLLACLEHHYGSLSTAEIVIPNQYKSALSTIKGIVDSCLSKDER